MHPYQCRRFKWRMLMRAMGRWFKEVPDLLEENFHLILRNFLTRDNAYPLPNPPSHGNIKAQTSPFTATKSPVPRSPPLRSDTPQARARPSHPNPHLPPSQPHPCPPPSPYSTTVNRVHCQDDSIPCSPRTPVDPSTSPPAHRCRPWHSLAS